MKNVGLKEKIHVASLMTLLVLTCGIEGHAQQAGPSETVSVIVPRMMRFSGTVTDTQGKAMSGVAGITFSIYKEQQGGAALWMETQNVNLDSTGHYTTLLGSTKPEGLPQDLFTSGEARWVEVQVQGQSESRRVLLLSVPYALKAADAETVGGLPASAFVLAAPPNNMGNGPTSSASSASTRSVLPPGTITGSGTTGFLPDFTGAATIGNSAVFQSGASPTAKIGINTSTPTTNLDVNGGSIIRGIFSHPATGAATATAGKNSQPENFIASSFNSSTIVAVNQTFQWQAEPAGNNTSSPSGTFNLLFGSGSSAPGETGLKISNKGIVTFATGQTFPGTGTIKSVIAGTDLTGGGSSGTVTLSLDTTKIPQLAAANTFSANQTVNGTLKAISFSGNGASLTNVNAARLGGLSASAFAQLAANNTFTGSQNIQNFVFIGTFSSLLNGELNAGAPSVSLSGMAAGGFTSAFGSGGSGSDGIQAFGGSGDLNTINGNTGGRGIFAEGGTGDIAGVGVYGRGIGGVQQDGSGGFFEGGNNSFFAGDGIDAVAGSGYAGNFTGNLNVTGSITAGVKDFKIDHPLDPANKYLVHASVESSEMMNIYTGNVVTDGTGDARVALPQWFEALNTDFRYQLTVIGQFAQAIVAREIQDHSFTIRTNTPHVKVSWQVTAVRQDAYAKAHPVVVEEPKEERLRGYYIHPELYGAAQQRQVEWARHQELMKQVRNRPSQGDQPSAQMQNVQPPK